jgi:hypothetical protein
MAVMAAVALCSRVAALMLALCYGAIIVSPFFGIKHPWIEIVIGLGADILNLGWLVAFGIYGTLVTDAFGLPSGAPYLPPGFLALGAVLNTIWWFILIQAFRWRRVGLARALICATTRGGHGRHCPRRAALATTSAG